MKRIILLVLVIVGFGVYIHKNAEKTFMTSLIFCAPCEPPTTSTTTFTFIWFEGGQMYVSSLIPEGRCDFNDIDCSIDSKHYIKYENK